MNRLIRNTLPPLIAIFITGLMTAVSLGLTQRQQVDLVIEGGITITMNPERQVYSDGLVAIRDHRIVAVGDRQSLAASFRPRHVIRAQGNAVLPGLINGHTHAPMTLLRGIADDRELHEWLTRYIFPAEAKNVNREFVLWGTRLACLEMIRGGTTTFADMYYFEDVVAEATAGAGMRGVLGETIIDFPSPDSETPQAALEFAETFIHKYRNHPLIIPAVAPHAPYTNTTETLKKAQALADAHDVPVLMHVAETQTEVEDVTKRFGARPVFYLDKIGLLTPRLVAAHVVHITPDEIDLMRRRRIGAVHNPQSNMKLASGVAPVPAMIVADIALGLGTDGAASNNTLDMFEAMKTAALLHKLASNDPKAVSAHQALEMATINGARALHREKEIGSLESGKLADVIIVGLDAPHQVPVYDAHSQLVYATEASDVKTVIINGRVVMRDQRVLTLDQSSIMTKVREFRSRIITSLK